MFHKRMKVYLCKIQKNERICEKDLTKLTKFGMIFTLGRSNERPNVLSKGKYGDKENLSGSPSSLLQGVPHAVQGGAQEDAHGQRARQGGGQQALGHEAVDLAPDGIVHGVENGRAGDQGEEGGDQIGGSGALAEPGHALSIEGHEDGRDQIGDGLRQPQGADAVDHPAHHAL